MIKRHEFVELKNGIRIPKDMFDFYFEETAKKYYEEFLGEYVHPTDEIDHLPVKEKIKRM